MEELKVKLYHIDNNHGMEIWEVNPQENTPFRYVGRDTEGEHTWNWLRVAPDGTYQREFKCSITIIFNLCDKNWHPLRRDGNDAIRFPHPFPKEKPKPV